MTHETKQQCEDVTEESCFNVPDTECLDVTKEVMETVDTEECTQEMDKQCEIKPEKKCHQEMEDVSCNLRSLLSIILLFRCVARALRDSAA